VAGSGRFVGRKYGMVLAVLQEGLNSAEHQAFVQQLAERQADR